MKKAACILLGLILGDPGRRAALRLPARNQGRARRPDAMVARGPLRHVHPLGPLRRPGRRMERQDRTTANGSGTTPRSRSTNMTSSSPQFNPVKFDAAEWVRMAKDAGMKYIVITSKHHDGFALFDSKVTDFDVMATPFKRDILKELSAACSKAGHDRSASTTRSWTGITRITCPAAPGKTRTGRPRARTSTGTSQYMKAQLKELVTGYGPLGVLWFDGEWENTWTRGLRQGPLPLRPVAPARASSSTTASARAARAWKGSPRTRQSARATSARPSSRSRPPASPAWTGRPA